MSVKKAGAQSVQFSNPPVIAGFASVAGKKENEGPLRGCFDYVSDDSYFGENTWEKAETFMQKKVFELACASAKTEAAKIDYVFAGDLLNQCIASALAFRECRVPYFGVYGACSTMAESLTLAAMAVDGGYASKTAAVCSSHFCTAERQFRFPLEYGGQRTPSSQWTATAAGCVILSEGGEGPFIPRVTTGIIRDAGVTDVNNMGAAMAPAAYETLSAHFEDFSTDPDYYDLIVTGDLGKIGHRALIDLFGDDGLDISARSIDCGMLLFSSEKQDVHAGGSGCGCSASVLCAYILREMRSGRWKNVLFAATGALLSTTSSAQKESIPGICHAVAISSERGAL